MKTNLIDSVNTAKDLAQDDNVPADATRKPRIGLKVRTRIKAGGIGEIIGGIDPDPVASPGNHGLRIRTAL